MTNDTKKPGDGWREGFSPDELEEARRRNADERRRILDEVGGNEIAADIEQMRRLKSASDDLEQRVKLYDFPFGWRHGFPAELPDGMTLEQLLRAKGYPEKDIPHALAHVRVIRGGLMPRTIAPQPHAGHTFDPLTVEFHDSGIVELTQGAHTIMLTPGMFADMALAIGEAEIFCAGASQTEPER